MDEPDIDAANAALQLAQVEPPTRPKQAERKIIPMGSQRLLPASPEAEEGLLGSFGKAPREVGSLCVQKGVKAEAFHIPANATMYQAMIDLWNEGKPIDFAIVGQRLKDRGEFERVGGAPFLSHILSYPTAANAREYLEIVQDKATLRKIIANCGRYEHRAYSEQDDVPALLEECERDTMSIRRSSQDRGGMTAKEVMAIGIDAIEKTIQLNGRIGGISTGFHHLDRMTDGLHGGTATAVCGLSGTGKSAIVMQIFEHIAVDLGVPVAIWPLEMGIRQMAKRQIASRARVNMVPWRNGTPCTEPEQVRIVQAASEISKAKMFFQPGSDCTIQAIRTNARHLVAMHGIKAVMIDSMSVLHSDSRQGRDNRTSEVRECAEGFKEMAKELDIAVFVIVHVDREIGRNVRPQPKSIRESAQVQQAFDNLWMIYEPDWEEGQAVQYEPRMGVYLPKQRDGEPDTEQFFKFERRFTRFREIPREPVDGQIGMAI